MNDPFKMHIWYLHVCLVCLKPTKDSRIHLNCGYYWITVFMDLPGTISVIGESHCSCTWISINGDYV